MSITSGRTCRVGASIVAGACHVGVRGLGLLGSEILAATSSGEHGAGAMANDSLVADREYRLIVSGSSFVPGTLQVFEDGGVEFTGPGTATQTLYEYSVPVGSAVSLVAGFTVATIEAGFAAALDTITGQLSVGPTAQANFDGTLAGIVGAIQVGTFTFGESRGVVVVHPALRTIGAQEII